jgi:hypothetical protein
MFSALDGRRPRSNLELRWRRRFADPGLRLEHCHDQSADRATRRNRPAEVMAHHLERLASTVRHFFQCARYVGMDLILRNAGVLDEQTLASVLLLDPADAGPSLFARLLGISVRHHDIEAIAPCSLNCRGCSLEISDRRARRDDRRELNQIEVCDARVAEGGVERPDLGGPATGRGSHGNRGPQPTGGMKNATDECHRSKKR